MPIPPRLGAAAILMAAMATASAADFGALKPQGFLSDFANVADAESRQRLERYGEQLRKATGSQIAIVTLPTVQGEPIEDVANLLFRKWGMGAKEGRRGVLLLLAVQERRSRLEVGAGLEEALPEGSAGLVLREMRPALREEHYGEALLAGAQAIGDRIAKHRGVAAPAAERQMSGRRRPLQAAPWALLVGGVVLLLWLAGAGVASRGRGRRRPAGGFHPGAILGNMLGRPSSPGVSTGGFGGYDSADSFGGFGGSDSGGGASRSW